MGVAERLVQPGPELGFDAAVVELYRGVDVARRD